MNLFSPRKLIILGAAALAMAAVPGTASAGGSVHIDIPGFSIGYYDDHRYRKRHRKHYRKHYRHHKRSHRYYRDHYDYRPYGSYNYYGGGYRSRDYYRPRYRDNRYDYCPTPGFSLRFYRNRGCYSHGNHYHCDD